MRRVGAIVLLGVVGCGGDRNGVGSASRGGAVEAWVVPGEPRVQVGVVAGDDVDQLHDVGGSALLPGGRIAVVNGGSGQVRLYDREGQFLRQFGARGEGPGEFLLATRIMASGDTLRIWDQRLRRFTWFDTLGSLLGTERLREDPAEPYPLDVWLYGRNLVDSPVGPEVRSAMARAIDALPAVETAAAGRFVRVTGEGHLWVAPSVPPAPTGLDWTVHDLDGSLRARVTTPAGFLPHEIGRDYLLGLWTNELDVNYVRLYDLVRPEGSVAGPGLRGVRAGGGPLPPTPRADITSLSLAALRSSLKVVASAQAMHYDEHGGYTLDASGLALEPPEGIRVDFFEAHPRGFTGIVTHGPTGVFCVMTYGFTVSMGWVNGRVVCPGT